MKVGGIEDLIRLGLVEDGIDDSLVTDYEQEYGPFDMRPPVPMSKRISHKRSPKYSPRAPRYLSIDSSLSAHCLDEYQGASDACDKGNP